MTTAEQYNLPLLRRTYRKYLRREFVTHHKACHVLDLDPVTMHDFLKGDKPHRPATIRKIAEALSVPLDDIMIEDED